MTIMRPPQREHGGLLTSAIVSGLRATLSAQSAAREQAVVANAVEAHRQHMDEETAD